MKEREKRGYIDFLPCNRYISLSQASIFVKFLAEIRSSYSLTRYNL